MKKIIRSIGHVAACSVLTVALPLSTVLCSHASKRKVKVFILCGQSNMEGKGSIAHLKQLACDPTEKATYGHLVDRNGEWVERDDVWIDFNGKRGKLTVGYAVPGDRFGPELQIGHLLGDAFEEQILLIKTAWGGRSLAVDFRPPSSGGETGESYKQMLMQVHDVLNNLKTYFPDCIGNSNCSTCRQEDKSVVRASHSDNELTTQKNYDEGYELAGFVWFQGWNDRINQSFNDQYEQNLANFIRDVRKELGVKELPFVIGETGQGGVDEQHPRAVSLMKAQANVATDDEFKDNVRFVETKIFYQSEPQHDGGYHWFGNAENFFNIGNAMGKALLDLLGKLDSKF